RFTIDSVRRGEAPSRVDIAWNAERIGSADKAELPFDVPAISDLTLISATTSSTDEQYATLLFSDPLDAAQDLTGLAGISGADDARVEVDGNKRTIHPTRRLSGAQQGYVSGALRNSMGRTLGR